MITILSIPNRLSSAYNPILVKASVESIHNPELHIPPVVWCDIYFNGVYYKSLAERNYVDVDNSGDERKAIVEFNLSNAAQEFLKTKLCDFGISEVTEDKTAITECFCKIRSSGLEDGIIDVEGPEPIQATKNTPAVEGGGTQTNSFFIINAALQLEDNPNLANHLSYFKPNENWGENTFPLTHRREDRIIGTNDTYTYPILTDSELTCLKLNYKDRNGIWHQANWCKPCQGLEIIGITEPLENAYIDVEYTKEFTLIGNKPFVIENVDIPEWLELELIGNKLNLKGTPTEESEDETISITISNCDGQNEETINTTLSVLNLIPPEIEGTLIMQVLTDDGSEISGFTPLRIFEPSLPAIYGQDCVSDHNGISGDVTIGYINGTSGNKLRVYKNDSVYQSYTMLGTGSGSKVFNMNSWDINDIIHIKIEAE